MYTDYNPALKYVLSIDIGVQHLGLVFAQVSQEFTMLEEIIWIDLIDITQFVHADGYSRKNCTLHHKKCFADYMEHVFLCHNELFEKADKILIEQQPPVGFVVIEQLIFFQYRHKSIILSPRSMHHFFGWTKYDYDTRKMCTEKMANLNLVQKNRVYLYQWFDEFQRKHDIADAICLLIYWLKVEDLELKQRLHVKRINCELIKKRKVNDWQDICILKLDLYKSKHVL